jgi:pimeloyl-ACP methyl ester carboxylesterase
MRPYLADHGDPADPLLLCLHGIGSCADAFEPQGPLADRLGRYVVAWDAPGYRHSPDPDRRFTLDDWADAAAAVIRAHATGDNGAGADVLGVSWGGVTATRLALRHPGLVRSLILADSSVGSGTTSENAGEMRNRARDLVELGVENFARSRAPRLVSPGAPAALVDDVARMMIDSVRMPIYEWACHSLADTDHTAALGDIGVPALVIVGAEDIITPLERSHALAQGIVGAQLVTVPDAGHLANQEQPAVFNDAVVGFLDGISGR